MIAFLNWVTSYLIYAIVYPEEAEICSEIQFIFKDLEGFVNQN